MNERKVPCLVVDITGKTGVVLERGWNSSPGHHKWKCNKTDCPIRTRFLSGNNGDAYLPLSVRLRTINKIHGVVNCEGGGIAKK